MRGLGCGSSTAGSDGGSTHKVGFNGVTSMMYYHHGLNGPSQVQLLMKLHEIWQGCID